MTAQLNTQALAGFSDVARQSNTVFRTVMNALANPGRLHQLEISLAVPPQLNLSAAAILMALADYETPLWFAPDITSELARAHFKFHTGCSITDDPQIATFAVATPDSDFTFLEELAVGNPENPHHSTTLIMLVDGFDGSEVLKLKGPGIKDVTDITPQRLPDDIITLLKRNEKLFPCGVDVLLTFDSQIVGIPRSTILEN